MCACVSNNNKYLFKFDEFMLYIPYKHKTDLLFLVINELVKISSNTTHITNKNFLEEIKMACLMFL